MAKAKMLSQVIHPSQIIWFRDTNLARKTGDYGNLDSLKESLVNTGWQLTGDGTIECEKLPEHLKARAFDERSSRWLELQTQAKVDPKKLVDLSVFEELYTKNGKIVEPEYLGISGNRRSEVFFDAMVIRRSAQQPISDEIPVMVKHYDSPLDRLSEQMRENEWKLVGFKQPSPVDKLLAAKEAIELGASQARVRELFKDGMGIKLWWIVELNARFPELRIVERMQLDPKDPEFVNVQSAKFDDLQKLGLRSNPEALAAHNGKIREKMEISGSSEEEILSKQSAPISASEVDSYFRGKREGGNADKIMKKETIENLSKNSPSSVARDCFKSVMTNNTDHMRVHRELAICYEACFKLAAHRVKLEALLLRCVDDPNLLG